MFDGWIDVLWVLNGTIFNGGGNQFTSRKNTDKLVHLILCIYFSRKRTHKI